MSTSLERVGHSPSMRPVCCEPFLDSSEAAELLRVNPRTLTRWARENYVPAIPLGEGERRIWRFRASDLEAWMLRRCGYSEAANIEPMRVHSSTATDALDRRIS